MATNIHISIQSDDFDVGDELDSIRQQHKNIGALVNFIGLCRHEDGVLSALEIEHYPVMAEKKIRAIAEKAFQRWDLQALTVIHRFGLIKAGEQIVLVITASTHRKQAFEAATFMMDYIKTDAPFWKKNHNSDGTAESWVEAHEADEIAKNSW